MRVDVRQLVESAEDESFRRATLLLIDATGTAMRSTYSCGQLPVKALRGAVIVIELFQRGTKVLARSSFASIPILKRRL